MVESTRRNGAVIATEVLGPLRQVFECKHSAPNIKLIFTSENRAALTKRIQGRAKLFTHSIS